MPVVNDLDAIRAMGVEVVSAPLVNTGDKIRHDPAAAARVALQLAKKGRRMRVSQLKAVLAT